MWEQAIQTTLIVKNKLGNINGTIIELAKGPKLSERKGMNNGHGKLHTNFAYVKSAHILREP